MQNIPADINENDDLVTELLNLEEIRAKAWIESNISALSELFAPDYVEINVLGRLNKKEVLESIIPSINLNTFQIEEPQVIYMTSDAALLTYRCTEKLTIKGETFSGISHVSAHYIRREGKWYLLFWQITPWTVNNPGIGLHPA